MAVKNNTTKKPDNKGTTSRSGIIGAGVPWFQKGSNARLIARIRPVVEQNIENGQGKQNYVADEQQPVVGALFEDGEFTTEAQYTTPFESSNPEGRMPNMMGMIQSGQLPASMYSLFGLDPSAADEGAIKGAAESAANSLQGLKDRSTFTKINSRQIYTSSSSVRITGTLVFQAWADAQKEVESALSLLQQWVLPRKLSSESLLVSVNSDGVDGMFPSIIPPLVQFQYGGRVYKPMFIESLSAPITAPMTKAGDRIAVKAQITLLSLTAWDKQDIANLKLPVKANK